MTSALNLGPRFAPENVSLPELITLGDIERAWKGQRPTHLTWTEDRLWKRGFLSKHRMWIREDRRYLIWFEITALGANTLEQKRREWRERRASTNKRSAT